MPFKNITPKLVLFTLKDMILAKQNLMLKSLSIRKHKGEEKEHMLS